MKKQKNTNDKEIDRKRKLSFYKILIILVIVFGMVFVVNRLFDTASDKVESMTQEEKDEVNDKWDEYMDLLSDE